MCARDLLSGLQSRGKLVTALIVYRGCGREGRDPQRAALEVGGSSEECFSHEEGCESRKQINKLETWEINANRCR